MSTQSAQLHTTPAKNHRFHLLDALRGLAALFVVVWHAPLYLRHLPHYQGGFLAVDFFFCLSGFVIAFSYEKRLARRISLKDFIVARAVRLYPLYLLGSVIGLLCAVFLEHVGTLEHLTAANWSAKLTLTLLMLPDLFRNTSPRGNFPFDGPAWSLFLEVVANIGYAILVKRNLAKNGLLLTMMLLCLLPLARPLHHGWMGIRLDVGWSPATFGLGLARVCVSFSAGVLVYRLYKRRDHLPFTGATRWISAALATAVLTILLYSPVHFMESEIVQLLSISVVFPAIVYFGAHTRLPSNMDRVCGFMGDFSYPLYVLHSPLVIWLHGANVEAAAHAYPAMQALVWPLILAAAIAAWLVGKYYDVPVRRFLTQKYNATKPIAPAKGSYA